MSIALLLFLTGWGWFGFGKQLPAYGQSNFNDPVPNLPQLEPNQPPEVPQLPPPQEFLPEDFLPTEENFPVIPGSITVTEFQFLGNTVFSQAELAELTKEFVGEAVTFAQLLAARSRITEHYINQGFITSGAYLPANQVIQDGIVTIQIIEDKLTKINVEGLERLQPHYLRSRINTVVSSPLNINDLITVLEQLKRNPLLENLSAELTASQQVGESVLNLKVEPANPLQVNAFVNNHQSPTIGTWQQQLELGHNNLLGWGDQVLVSYTDTSGGREWEINYTIPINGSDGTIRGSYQNFTADIIEEPFDQIDLEVASEQYEIAFRQPIINHLTEELALGVVFFHQTSQTRLLGVPYPLSLGADEDGEIRVSGVRLFQEWTKKSSQDVLQVRNQFSFGLDWFNATENGTDPDSQFFSWQLQGQWLYSLGKDHLILSRIQGQISDRALLSAEDLSLGGAGTVRGYRQDLYLVDRGVLASVDYRFPLLRINDWRSVVQGVSFVDFAWGENVGASPDLDPNYLASVGVGLRWQVADSLSAEVSWALPLVEVSDRAEERLLFSISIR